MMQMVEESPSDVGHLIDQTSTCVRVFECVGACLRWLDMDFSPSFQARHRLAAADKPTGTMQMRESASQDAGVFSPPL